MSREAFEKWVIDWFGPNHDHAEWELDDMYSAWKACSEHYEAVMRRAVDSALEYAQPGMGRPDVIERIIKRAREE